MSQPVCKCPLISTVGGGGARTTLPALPTPTGFCLWSALSCCSLLSCQATLSAWRPPPPRDLELHPGRAGPWRRACPPTRWAWTGRCTGRGLSALAPSALLRVAEATRRRKDGRLSGCRGGNRPVGDRRVEADDSGRGAVALLGELPWAAADPLKG
jgi:hypothetical protein